MAQSQRAPGRYLDARPDTENARRTRPPAPSHVCHKLRRLFVEPDILPPGAVEDAVRVDHLVPDPGPAAAAAIGVEDDRPDVFLGQLVLDLPEDLLASRRVAHETDSTKRKKHLAFT